MKNLLAAYERALGKRAGSRKATGQCYELKACQDRGTPISGRGVSPRTGR